MTYKYLGVIAILLFWGSLCAQEQVYPGDANNNGRVDQYDILPIGYAYGQVGPARIETVEDGPQAVAVDWATDFPGGLNYIYADANGNGLVEILDFVAVSQNFGEEFPPVTELPFLTGIAGEDPSIIINDGLNIDPLLAGAVVEIPIVLSFPADAVADSINGIAFEIAFDHTHFSTYSFEFSDEWMTADGNAFTFKRTGPGKIAIALTRYGPDPTIGGGPIGTLSLIIIDDLIALMEEAPDTMPSKVRVRGVQVVDQDYEPVPVVEDSITLKLYRPGTVSPVRSSINELGSSLYPNPVRAAFILESKSDFHLVECLDVSGHRLLLYQGEPRRRWEGALELPSGFYCLRLTGQDGISLLPMIIQE